MAASSGRDGRGTLVAVSLALFCIQLDFFGLNLAVPAIAQSLSATTDDVQWVVSAYMLALGSLFILGGRLGDIFGRKPALIAGVAIFGGAAVLCATAPTLWWLIAFRVVAGMGAALIFPVGIAVISNAFDKASRAKALGLTFAIANIGTAVGPFVGGGLAQGPGWRWVFWALVPVCAVSLVVAVIAVRDSRDQSAARRVDSRGALLLILGIASLSFAVDRSGTWGLASAQTLGLVAVAIALLVGFLIFESKVSRPLVDLTLFRNPPYVLVTALGAVTNIGYGVTVFVITLYLQNVRGLSPLVAGVAFLAPAILVSLAGPAGARIKPYFRPTVIMAGAAVIGAGALLGLTYVSTWWAFIPLFALAGFGFGLGWTFANVATQGVVDPDRAGEASGVLLTVLVTMSGIGLAIVATAIGSMESDGHPPQSAYFAALRAIAIVTVCWASLVMAIRAILVRRGIVAPLSLKQPANEAAVGTGASAQRP